jgi:hypothetical protein
MVANGLLKFYYGVHNWVKTKFQVFFKGNQPTLGWLQVGFNGCVHTMKCKICSKVEHENKSLVPKWGSP